MEMHALRIGDEVRTAKGFERVLGFTHRAPEKRANVVTITLEDGSSIAATRGHLLPVGELTKLVAVSSIGVGDVLFNADLNAVRVVHVDTDEHIGLYNPHTTSGTIVVDGIVASVYNDGYDTRIASFLLSPALLVAEAALSFSNR